MRHVRRGGGRLSAFALLHGGGQGSWVWADTIAALDAQSGGAATVLALDVPGCGAKRDRATGGLTLPDVAAELIADIEAAGLRDVVLVGHSQGGQAMALMLAARADLFLRAVHVATSLPLPGQTILEMIGGGVHGSDPETVGWPFDPQQSSIRERAPAMFCNDMTAGQAEAFLARLGADDWPAKTYDFTDWDREPPRGVPASYVVCLRDGILPVAWQERFAERFAAGRVVRIDAGHQAMVTRPQALAEVLLVEAGLGTKSSPER